MPQRPHLTATPATDRLSKRPTQPASRPTRATYPKDLSPQPPTPDLTCPLESHTQITQTCTSLCNALINFVCTNIVPPLSPSLSLSPSLPLSLMAPFAVRGLRKSYRLFVVEFTRSSRIESSATNVKFAGKMFSTFHFVFRPANATCHVPLVVAKHATSPQLSPLHTVPID